MKSIQKTLIEWNIWEINDKELLNLILGRAGGKTTIRIIDLILDGPLNKNQIARTLHLDYKTVSYHIHLFLAHNYITEIKCDNIYFYHPSKKLFSSIEEYKLLRKHILNQKKNGE